MARTRTLWRKNKHCEVVTAILELLPGGKAAYTSDPPPDDKGGAFSFFYDYNDCETEALATWPLDLSKLVRDLFEGGLATDDNLNMLFGMKGYVSYQICELKEQCQPRIETFVSRRRIWKEGCTDYDRKLGLRIKFLNKSDRRLKFGEMRGLMPMGNVIQHMKPSLEQFITRFGWAKLGLDSDSYMTEYYRPSDASDEECVESMSKRSRSELGSLLTVNDACKYYFNTATLEEAIWDFVGVPRLIAIGCSVKKIKKLGWEHQKVTAVLGDDSVQLGKRVVHVYDGCCTIWKEEDSQPASANEMDTSL